MRLAAPSTPLSAPPRNGRELKSASSPTAATGGAGRAPASGGVPSARADRHLAEASGSAFRSVTRAQKLALITSSWG